MRDADVTLKDADGQLLPGGSLQTSRNGEWSYFADAPLPSEGQDDGEAVTVAVTSNGQSVSVDVFVHPGQRNFIQTLSLPEN